MKPRRSREHRPLRARYEITDRSLGDYAVVDRPAPAAWRVPARPWTWLHQVHGGRVVTVTHPGEHAGIDADGAVTAVPGCVLVVRSADCAPVVLRGEGVIGLAHAGWRGLLDGVVERTVDAMMALGASDVAATIGPCIRPECYEFGSAELDVVAGKFGDGVRSSTAANGTALDLVAAVRSALGHTGVRDVVDPFPCTGCDRRWFSHRARGEVQRMATFVWLEW